MDFRSDWFSRHSGMLFWVTLISLGAFFLRNQLVQDHSYNFLLWNLFLGFVPLFFAWLVDRFEARFGAWFLWGGSALWLLFYPNAPYMISDFIHVNQQDPNVLYDALMIFNIAMLSIFYGLYSLRIMRDVFDARYGSKIANMIIAASIILAAFGVYLGRILRLNSWDVFTQPLKTFKLIFDHLFPFGDNPQTWLLVIIFSGLQLFLLVLVHGLNGDTKTGR